MLHLYVPLQSLWTCKHKRMVGLLVGWVGGLGRASRSGRRGSGLGTTIGSINGLCTFVQPKAIFLQHPTPWSFHIWFQVKSWKMPLNSISDVKTWFSWKYVQQVNCNLVSVSFEHPLNLTKNILNTINHTKTKVYLWQKCDKACVVIGFHLVSWGMETKTFSFIFNPQKRLPEIHSRRWENFVCLTCCKVCACMPRHYNAVVKLLITCLVAWFDIMF